MSRRILFWSGALSLVFGLGCGSTDNLPVLTGIANGGFGGGQVTGGNNGVAGNAPLSGAKGGTSAAIGGTLASVTGGRKSTAGIGGSSVKAGSGGAGARAAGSGGTTKAPTGSGACDTADPPANVKAWIDESWNGEGKPNITGRTAWLSDAAMKGKGQINVCVRWGATPPLKASDRDRIEGQVQTWFNQWFSRIYPYDCFPYENITVKVTGYAVRPGKQALIPTTTTPIYTEAESGSTPAGEPKCPDACGFFFNWNHSFPNCPGGEAAHFDYSLWLDDSLPGSGGAAAVGGDWGLRMPVDAFIQSLGVSEDNTILHEMGHGFGLSDYYTWTGSKPSGGSIMIVGSTMSGVPTEADKWIARRYWKETKALRYP